MAACSWQVDASAAAFGGVLLALGTRAQPHPASGADPGASTADLAGPEPAPCGRVAWPASGKDGITRRWRELAAYARLALLPRQPEPCWWTPGAGRSVAARHRTSRTTPRPATAPLPHPAAARPASRRLASSPSWPARWAKRTRGGFHSLRAQRELGLAAAGRCDQKARPKGQTRLVCDRTENYVCV